MEQENLTARVDAEARELALTLIEIFIGPDNRVLNKEGFISALVEALKNAREQGQLDRSDESEGL